MLDEYTCGRQIAMGCTYLVDAYTCGGQIASGCTYTLIAFTCGGQIARGRTCMQIAKNLLGVNAFRTSLLTPRQSSANLWNL